MEGGIEGERMGAGQLASLLLNQGFGGGTKGVRVVTGQVDLFLKNQQCLGSGGRKPLQQCSGLCLGSCMQACNPPRRETGRRHWSVFMHLKKDEVFSPEVLSVIPLDTQGEIHVWGSGERSPEKERDLAQ